MRSYIIIIFCLYAYSGLFDHMPVLHAGVHCVRKQEQNHSCLRSAGGVRWHTLKKCGCADPEGVCLCG